MTRPLSPHLGGGMRRVLVAGLRALPPGLPGKHRLARRLLGRLGEVTDARVQDRWGSTYTAPDLTESIAFSLLIDGVYEPATLAFIRGRLGRGSVFVDVGANIGVFSLPAARQVGPEGRVLGVEASSIVFGYLERNVRANGARNVRLHQCAVTDGRVSPVAFYDAPRSKFGMGSMADRFGGPPTAVHARRLDDLVAEEAIPRVDVLKVDVEGFEAAVFRGATRLLNGPLPPVVVFEFCDWAERSAPGEGVGAAQRLLLGWGYHLWRIPDRPGPAVEPLRDPLEHGFAMLAATRP